MTETEQGAHNVGADGNRSVDKVVRLLEAFDGQNGLGASELGRAMGVDRSTALRLARVLERHGWLRYDTTGRKFWPGIRLWEIGCLAVTDVDMRSVALPCLKSLSAASGQPSDLAVLDGFDAVYIEHVPGTRVISVNTRLGMRAPAHAVAMGKVLAAHLPEDRLKEFLDAEREAFTYRTICAPDLLAAELTQVRSDNWAINWGEWREEAGGVSAAIFDRNSNCVAALSVDLLASSMSDDVVNELKPRVQNAAADVSRQLGARLSEVGYSQFEPKS
jgi:DNA-binding IclR family transcriptional regulator